MTAPCEVCSCSTGRCIDEVAAELPQRIIAAACMRKCMRSVVSQVGPAQVTTAFTAHARPVIRRIVRRTGQPFTRAPILMLPKVTSIRCRGR